MSKLAGKVAVVTGASKGIGAALAAGVVDDDRGALSGKFFGDGGADAFGGSGDDSDFSGELGHG